MIETAKVHKTKTTVVAASVRIVAGTSTRYEGIVQCVDRQDGTIYWTEVAAPQRHHTGSAMEDANELFNRLMKEGSIC